MPSQTKDQLAVLAGRTRRTRLAGRTRRTSSFLAAAAIAEYVARELAIVQGIEQGQAEIRSGQFSSHAEVAREAQSFIKAAQPKP